MEAEITLEYDDAKDAEAVAKAVSPDNFKVPPSLSIETKSKENKVITYIECKRRISTFIATIDDLLFCVSTAEKTLQTAKKLM
ncbi:KEOPS complex subunit [Candidatus Bathyarchaeota archaeon]|nr:KEOPS complex subunit [Candidatus Bathyarchaeota archaeon]